MMKGIDILFICIGVSIFIGTIFKSVIPIIFSLTKENNYIKVAEKTFDKIETLNNSILNLQCDLHIATSQYKDIDARKNAAMKLSDSIVKFIIEPTVEKE